MGVYEEEQKNYYCENSPTSQAEGGKARRGEISFSTVSGMGLPPHSSGHRWTPVLINEHQCIKKDTRALKSTHWNLVVGGSLGGTSRISSCRISQPSISTNHSILSSMQCSSMVTNPINQTDKQWFDQDCIEPQRQPAVIAANNIAIIPKPY